MYSSRTRENGAKAKTLSVQSSLLCKKSSLRHTSCITTEWAESSTLIHLISCGLTSPRWFCAEESRSWRWRVTRDSWRQDLCIKLYLLKCLRLREQVSLFISDGHKNSSGGIEIIFEERDLLHQMETLNPSVNWWTATQSYGNTRKTLQWANIPLNDNWSEIYKPGQARVCIPAREKPTKIS